MASFLNSLVPGNIKQKLKKLIFGTSQFRIHFSQSGEYIILIGILREFVKLKTGFYVDVGAFHPTLSSNTYGLYKNGWNGINIEPRPGSKNLFDKIRPRDINIEAGIGASKSTLQYYYISETSTMNSFSKKTMEDNGVYNQVQKVVDCEVITLNDVLENYLPPEKQIDFLNIDAEGFELEVISTINWKVHQPKIIAIEQNGITMLEDVFESETYKLLNAQNYAAVAKNIVAKTVATVIYVDKKFL